MTSKGNLGQTPFGVVDYSVVGLTLVVSIGIGLYHGIKGRGTQTSEEMLVGARKLTAIPVGISMLVTYFSASAVIGFPAEIYGYGMQMFIMVIILTLLCIPLAAGVFVTVFYKLKLTSVFEYLEYRFDSTAVRCLASALSIFETCTQTGMALYVPSIPLEAFFGFPIWVSVIGIGVIGTTYTAIGGVKAVIWTDVFQFCLIIVGMGAIVISGFTSAGGISQALEKAEIYGRLKIFNWNLNPFEKYNTINFICGYGLYLVCFYGSSQQHVQRCSSLPTLKAAFKAMTLNAMLKVFTTSLVICAGVAIFANYAGCDPILLGQIRHYDQIVPFFFIQKLSWIPGMLGILTACIFSAILSTISSALNSLAAITWKDFLCRLKLFERMGPIAKGRITILLAALYGFIIMGLSFVLGQLGSVFQVTLTVFGAFGGTIGSSFLMGLFLPFVNKVGVFNGMVTSITVTSFIIYQSFLLKQSSVTLPNTIDSCPAGTDFSMAANGTIIYQPQIIEHDWPTKLYSISYVLYPLVAILIAIVTGTIVSVVSQYFMKPQPDTCFEYIHPWVKCFVKTRSDSAFSGKDKMHYHPDGNLRAVSLKYITTMELNGNYKKMNNYKGHWKI